MKNSLLQIGAILLILFITACQNGANSSEFSQVEEKDAKTAEEETQEERAERLESGILHYGEGVKGGQFGITLSTAYSELNTFRESKTSHQYVVTAVVRVRNVTHDQTLNAGNIGFKLESEKLNTSYDGELLPNMNPSDTEIEPEKNVYLQVTFEVPNIEEDYMLSAHLFNESSMEPRWKLQDLKEFN
ncbi:hypothetical protein KO561_03025 [Radiobacillus kanasensis]|uniref:hypothetical protein n=1 Tax=Radiobacillus kanasensis TaxID=2844358 RepID=UPI001E520C41|nr:hypothetical protein [Radiobacillus kanasensis]UFT99949.1 hypothetical protein KO561_03025 [Radiobacillus kanasensis]